MNSDVVITLDCDWAPDFVIEDVADRLSDKKIKAVWFVTHESPILNKLKKNKLFELGIHPNFLPNSTQGKSFEQIMSNLKKIIPTAKTIRTHGLFQSTWLLSKFHEYGIENDTSLLLYKSKHLTPHYSNYFKLHRFPFFWEDDIEMEEKPKWDKLSLFDNVDGLKIFDFHPLHIFLNSLNFNKYKKIKSDIQLENLNEKNIQKFMNQKYGAGTYFDKLISTIQESSTIQDLRYKYSDFFKKEYY
jgi:hypothetical protein